MNSVNIEDPKKAAARLTAFVQREGFKPVAMYPYKDKDGETQFLRLRLEKPDSEKRIFPMSCNGKDWELKEPEFPSGKKLLYKLPEILKNPESLVWLPEGENKTNALSELGVVSATSGGSTSAGKADWTPLKGRNVVIWPDNDAPGAKYADDVTEILLNLGCQVERIDVSQLDLHDKGDVIDWLQNNPKATKEDIENLPRIDTKVSGDTNKAAWLEPVPLDTAHLPDFPTEIFTGWLGDIFIAVAKATETPPELSAMIGLAVIATACQRKYIVQIEDGYREPSNIWAVSALPSGNRKTSVLQSLTRPLLDWECEKAGAAKQEIKRVESERKTLETRVQSLRGQAAKAKPDEYEKIKNEIIALEETLPDIPTMPRLWAQDITPEQTGKVMADHGEKLSILSDEGGLFELLGGRYSGGIPNLDLFLQAHAGSPVRVDRGSRPSVHMQSPALTIGLSPQPEVLQGLYDKPGFRGRGLLARFLYTLPASRLGYRSLNTEPVPASVAMAYHRGINALLETQAPTDENDRVIPYILRFSQPAFNEWKEFSHVVEKDMREGGRFDHITDWAGKLPGVAARIAGLLHCVEHAHAKPHEVEISHETMQRALTLAAVLSEHALAVFDLMGADPALDGARRVWRWVKRERNTSFTVRDCFNALKGHFKRVAHLEPALEVLLERHYIIPLEDDTPRGPGRPSREYMLNPRLSEGWK